MRLRPVKTMMATQCQYCTMEQILPVLEGQLRRFRHRAASMAAQHPRLAPQLGRPEGAQDAHVDRLVQGVATLHARAELVLQRARCQQDEYLLESHFPEQLRPFPECRIGPVVSPAASIRAARYIPGPGAAIELDIDAGAPGVKAIDVYIDGDPAFSAALRSALLACGRFTATGLDPSEALLPRMPGAHAGLALLREFFIFPARFNVLRLGLAQSGGARCCTLRFPAPDMRLLEALQASHLRAGWAAHACLQGMAATPVMLNGLQSEYPLSVPPECEIFSIDRVHVGGAGNIAWTARRVEDAAPGHEWRFILRDEGGGLSGAVASVDVSCCQRSAVLARAQRGSGCRWQLNSLLALEQLPWNADVLREVMMTQAINNSAEAQAIISAVHRVDAQPALLRMGGAAPLQGTELRLQLDEQAFAGCGPLLFAQIMDRFFGECAHMNTFTRLVLASARTGEELIRCKARNGGTVLE